MQAKVLTKVLIRLLIAVIAYIVGTILAFRFLSTIAAVRITLVGVAALCLFVPLVSWDLGQEEDSGITPEWVARNNRYIENTIGTTNRLIALLHFRATGQKTIGIRPFDSFRSCLEDVGRGVYSWDDYSEELNHAYHIVEAVARSGVEEDATVGAVEWGHIPALLTELRSRLSSRTPVQDLWERLYPPPPPSRWRTRINRILKKNER